MMPMKQKSDGLPAASLPDRRKGQIMADLVDVGLLFVLVFGRDQGPSFFHGTIVAPHAYQPVLLGEHLHAGESGRPNVRLLSSLQRPPPQAWASQWLSGSVGTPGTVVKRLYRPLSLILIAGSVWYFDKRNQVERVFQYHRGRSTQ